MAFINFFWHRLCFSLLGDVGDIIGRQMDRVAGSSAAIFDWCATLPDTSCTLTIAIKSAPKEITSAHFERLSLQVYTNILERINNQTWHNIGGWWETEKKLPITWWRKHTRSPPCNITRFLAPLRLRCPVSNSRYIPTSVDNDIVLSV